MSLRIFYFTLFLLSCSSPAISGQKPGDVSSNIPPSSGGTNSAGGTITATGGMSVQNDKNAITGAWSFLPKASAYQVVRQGNNERYVLSFYENDVSQDTLCNPLALADYGSGSRFVLAQIAVSSAASPVGQYILKGGFDPPSLSAGAGKKKTVTFLAGAKSGTVSLLEWSDAGTLKGTFSASGLTSLVDGGTLDELKSEFVLKKCE